MVMVEDSLADVDVVLMALESAAVFTTTQVFVDGASAIEYFEQVLINETNCPQLLILDLNLPKVRGPELLRRLRALPWCGRTKVIVV